MGGGFLLVKLNCARIQVVVSAFHFKELVVVAAFDYLALLEDHYGVRVSYGGESVGNDEGGSVFHQSVHTVLDMALGSGVYGAGSLVKYQYGSF